MEKMDLSELSFNDMHEVGEKPKVKAEVTEGGLILKDEKKGISISIPVCSDEEIEAFEKQEREYREAEKHENYKNSGVPKKFFDFSIDDFKAENDTDKYALSIVRNFIKAPKNKVILLLGNSGNGKTLLGCGAVREIGGQFRMSEDICVEYDSASDFNSKKTRSEVLQYYVTRKLLVIDELMKYSIRPSLEAWIISYIIRMRYENNLPTVLITNGTKKEFSSFVGSAVNDRLKECCISVEFSGESHRVKDIEF